MGHTRLDITQTATILEGQSESTAINSGMSGILEGMTMPSTWTTGNITFKVSLEEDGDYLDMYDADGNPVIVYPQANTFITLNGLVTRGMRYVKLISTSNQGSDREIKVHIRNEL
jgi:hypothetical protein